MQVFLVVGYFHAQISKEFADLALLSCVVYVEMRHLYDLLLDLTKKIPGRILLRLLVDVHSYDS